LRSFVSQSALDTCDQELTGTHTFEFIIPAKGARKYAMRGIGVIEIIIYSDIKPLQI
jgi:hypothetical protein